MARSKTKIKNNRIVLEASRLRKLSLKSLPSIGM